MKIIGGECEHGREAEAPGVHLDSTSSKELAKFQPALRCIFSDKYGAMLQSLSTSNLDDGQHHH
jgi:hypothetical protein